ncbi:MAG TPA: glycosyltransferase [Gemmatimonadaceae bacterium]|nr:glycosyltransferase [Gemmatimonadaceae bacterium]
MSVVVPLYNEERWVDECLRALAAQDYPEDRYEILVVDNNSTDRSLERVARHPRARLLHEPVQGDFAARNRGIVESRGDILAFTDADTAPHADWIRTIAANLTDGVSLLVGRLEFGGKSRLLELLEAYEAEKGEFVFSSGIPSIYFGYTCNMAARRSLFDRMGLFPPVFRNADVVLVRRTVDELSPSALAFCDAMRVRRLEVPGVRQYYRKQMTYGRDFPRYERLAGARTLDLKQRFQVFGRTVRRNRLGPIDTARLLAVLAVGAISYDVAKGRARVPAKTTST